MCFPRWPSFVGSALAIFALLIAPLASAAPSPLSKAAESGDVAALNRALDEGADPNEADAEGVTALHIAAHKGHLEIARELLRRGADVDQAEFDGDTPLINAAAFGHVEIVRLLIDSGASLDVESSRGFTPIQHARRGRHSAVVKLLNRTARQAKTTASASDSTRLSGSNLRGRAPSSTRPAKTYRVGYQKRIAAVIGVNDYLHWPKLTGARADAEKVAAQLDALGFDEVLVLYDRNATRDGILALLGSRLPAIVGEDDLVVIFFAGHGQTETLGGSRGTKRGYIIPVDASVEGVFQTAIPMQQLRDLTNRLAAKHVYYAMDSCYSGLGFTRALGFVMPGADNYIDKVTSLRAVQMVTAGGEGEEAIEIDGQGVFTRSFIDALRGKADANRDGYVTATEIGAYVAPRVTNETEARQSPQSGRLEGEGEIAFKVAPRR
jgi:hypothetical protein